LELKGSTVALSGASTSGLNELRDIVRVQGAKIPSLSQILLAATRDLTDFLNSKGSTSGMALEHQFNKQ
jgi:hypothetical protein